MQDELTLESSPIIVTSCIMYCDVNKKSKCCKKYKKKGKTNCRRCPRL